MDDVQPISERLMTLTLNSIRKIQITSAYAPTAAASDKNKKAFYEALRKLHNKSVNKGPTFVLGDFNAGVQKRLNEDETCIGQHTFNKEHTYIQNQSPEVAENR